MAATQITTHKNYIGGQWVDSVTGRTYQVHNPARIDQIVGEFQTSGAEDALRAVAAAKDGLAVWANTPAPARATIIYKALEIPQLRIVSTKFRKNSVEAREARGAAKVYHGQVCR